MKTTIILIAVFLLSAFALQAQMRAISGRVISELDKDPLPGVIIWDKNNFTLGKTDLDGRFRINIPASTEVLVFRYIGFESAKIYLTRYCDTVELVLIDRPTRDFMSPRRMDRERLSSFEKLTDVYSQAYQKGLFTHPSPCYTRMFEPEWPKPRLDSIRKLNDKNAHEVKLTFRSLKVGDTVYVPFYISNPRWPNDTSNLSYSSFTSTQNDYDYIFQCLVVDKIRQKRRFNLVLNITACKLCKQPATLQGQLMKPGKTFTHNMRYHKILEK